MTNIRTGKPEYVQIKSVFDQMDVLRASGSMPVVSKPVKLGHEWYLDGAVTDSIPYELSLIHICKINCFTKNLKKFKKIKKKCCISINYTI